MRVLLVRHAHAGQRGSWPGDDLDRELTERGRAQAKAIASVWCDHRSFVQLASSRAVRCVQTITPLARKLDMKVEHEPVLLERSDPRETLAWLTSREGHTIASSHGDIIGGVVELLLGMGVRMRNVDGHVGPPRWQKAGAWELRVKDGEVLDGRYHAPPG